MKKTLLIFSLALLLSGCAIKNTVGCHGKTEVGLSTSPGVFSSDEKSVYTFVRLNYYKPAIGICAFPDGGISLQVYQGLDLYKINLVSGNVEKMYTMSDEDLDGYTFYVGRSPNLFTTHKSDRYFYGKANIQKKDDTSSRDDYIYFQVELSSGKVEEIKSKEEYNNLTKDVQEIKNGSDKNSNGEAFNLFFDENSIPEFRLFNLNTKHVILNGYDWLPYKF